MRLMNFQIETYERNTVFIQADLQNINSRTIVTVTAND